MKAKRLAELILTCGSIDTSDYIVETFDPDLERWMPITKGLFDLNYARIRLYTDTDETVADLVAKLSRDERREIYDSLHNEFFNPADGKD